MSSFASDQPEPVEILNSKLDFSGKVFGVRVDSFRYRDMQLTREYVEHPGAVAILAVDDAGRVATITQYRHPARQTMVEIPAGLLDVPGESKLDAAKRELAEEVDLVAENWEELITFYTSPGGSNESITVFLATGIMAAPEKFGRVDEEAEMGFEWIKMADLLEGILAGRLHNPSLVTAVLAYVARSRG